MDLVSNGSRLCFQVDHGVGSEESALSGRDDFLVDFDFSFSLFFDLQNNTLPFKQIKMALEDMEKTIFITKWGMFCYKVTPFDLKNAWATYQWAMVALFHDIMHKEIEVYMDDMISKSRMEKEHINNLRKLFERLRKYQFRLNPTKCTFGVKS
ncbi:Retrovirus-related Pol polyprotein from transposon 17.6, partial [Mucuna pruriens]